MDTFFKKLEKLQEEKILSDLDLQFCRFLNRQDEDIPESVLLAACLTSYLNRQGNVCIDLKELANKSVFKYLEGGGQSRRIDLNTPVLEEWLEGIEGSRVVGQPGEYTPLILDGQERLYIHKHWNYEQQLAENIRGLIQKLLELPDKTLAKDGLERLFNESDSTDWQKVAAVTALHSRFTVITGGPGTGKTSTIIRILAMMLEQEHKSEDHLRIALAASTGKAARRLKESMEESKPGLNTEDAIKDRIPEEPKTLHQLLGARYYGGSFKYGKEHPLPYDLVMVDEASMVDQMLMSRLIAALPDYSRIILLGDKDQLASVEAGSVLGDICGGDINKISDRFAGKLRSFGLRIPDELVDPDAGTLNDCIIELTENYRFGKESGIGTVAGQINSGNTDAVLDSLTVDRYADIVLESFDGEEEFYEALKAHIVPRYRQIVQLQEPGEVLDYMNGSKIISAHRIGPLGSQHLNQLAERVLHHHELISAGSRWYKGRPVMITRNDYSLNLRNGDLGVTWNDKEGQLRVYFEDRKSNYRSIVPSRLPEHVTAHAMTVHKSQGSEFDQVIFVLPSKTSGILTRELVYTAITRSRESCRVWGMPEILSKAVDKKMQRFSGLKELLWA